MWWTSVKGKLTIVVCSARCTIMRWAVVVARRVPAALCVDTVGAPYLLHALKGQMLIVQGNTLSYV